MERESLLDDDGLVVGGEELRAAVQDAVGIQREALTGHRFASNTRWIIDPNGLEVSESMCLCRL